MRIYNSRTSDPMCFMYQQFHQLEMNTHPVHIRQRHQGSKVECLFRQFLQKFSIHPVRRTVTVIPPCFTFLLRRKVATPLSASRNGIRHKRKVKTRDVVSFTVVSLGNIYGCRGSIRNIPWCINTNPGLSKLNYTVLFFSTL